MKPETPLTDAELTELERDYGKPWSGTSWNGIRWQKALATIASLKGELDDRETALRDALAKGVPCVKIPALTKDGEDFAAQYIAIDPKYWNEEADRMVVRFPDMPYREWRALSGEGSNQ